MIVNTPITAETKAAPPLITKAVCTGALAKKPGWKITESKLFNAGYGIDAT